VAEHPVHRWIREYERAWRDGDGEAIAQLYAADCPYRSHPFRELENARDYARRVVGAESEIEPRFGEPIIEGDRASVEWWASLVEDGREVTLAGFCWLRFGADGLVADSRDYWAEAEGRRAPPEGWGS